MPTKEKNKTIIKNKNEVYHNKTENYASKIS